MNTHTQIAPAATVQAADFRNAAAFAGLCTERWPRVPVLSMLRVSVEPGRLSIAGTDLDTEGEATIEADTDARFAFLASAGLVKRMAAHAARLRIAPAGDLVTVTADDLTIRLRPLAPASDWPTWGNVAGQAVTVAIPEATLHRAIACVRHAISTEETRYYLNGIFLDTEDGRLRTVATDGHRLAAYQTDTDWPIPPAILPTRAVMQLASRLRPGGNGVVTVEGLVGQDKSGNPDRPRVTFRGDGWTLRTKTIDGTYPAWRRVVPSSQPTIAVAVTLAGLRRFTLADGPSVALRFDPARQTMSTRGVDSGTEIEAPARIVADIDKPFGLKLRYLLAAARNGPTIRLEGTGPGEPFRALTEDPNLLQIIMPMRV